MGKRGVWMRLLAALASGILVAGLFPPFHFGVVVWLALVPLLAALWSLDGKRAAWKGFGFGYLAGAVSCGIQFNWLTTVSGLGAVILPAYLAIFWGLFGMFAATRGNPRRAEKPAGRLWLCFSNAAVWAGLELLRGWLFTGFGWNPLGVAFHDQPLFNQAADLLGVAGLSLAVVFFQAALLLAARERRAMTLIAPVLTVGALAGYSAVRLNSDRGASTRLKSLLVQLNIPQDAGLQLWSALEVHTGYEEETLAALSKLTKPGENRWPDWVVWPETALTGRILRGEDGAWATWEENLITISNVRRAGPFQLIYGVNELEGEYQGENLVMKPKARAYNSIAVMSPEDELQTFRKHHLVIFGETIPFVETFPLLKKIYEQQSGVEFGGSFTPGESLDPLPIPAGGQTIGAIPTVCFEDTVPRLTRKFVRPGPQVILNVTNDGWFKQSAAAAQHFANARFRAIELRRPMLRCANSGVSAAVDTFGFTTHPDTGKSQVLVDEKGSHFTRGSLLVELDIPHNPPFSLYAIIGDWGLIGIAVAGIAVAGIAIGWRLGAVPVAPSPGG